VKRSTFGIAAHGAVALTFLVTILPNTAHCEANAYSARCAADSLFVLLRNSGKNVDGRDLRNCLHPDGRMASAAAVVETAGRYGLDLMAVRVKRPDVSGLKYCAPCILHMRQDHFITLIAADQQSALISDSLQMETRSLEELGRSWSGVALIRSPSLKSVGAAKGLSCPIAPCTLLTVAGMLLAPILLLTKWRLRIGLPENIS